MITYIILMDTMPWSSIKGFHDNWELPAPGGRGCYKKLLKSRYMLMCMEKPKKKKHTHTSDHGILIDLSWKESLMKTSTLSPIILLQNKIPLDLI